MERSYRQIFVGNYSFSLFHIEQIIKTIFNTAEYYIYLTH